MTWEVLDEFARSKGLRIGMPSIGQTVSGNHVGGSFHYTGHARDYGKESDAIGVSRLFAPIAANHPDLIPEMFGIDGVGFDSGKPFQAPGHTGDHTHVAIGAGVTVERLQEAFSGASVPIVGSGSSGSTSSGSEGNEGILATLFSARTALRLVEVIAGSVLILMGLVALSSILKGTVPA